MVHPRASFDTGIRRSLIIAGVALSPDLTVIVDKQRRIPIASSRYSLEGFQHGRCFYCHESLGDLAAGVDVDHVYAWSNLKNLLFGPARTSTASETWSWPTPAAEERISSTLPASGPGSGPRTRADSSVLGSRPVLYVPRQPTDPRSSEITERGSTPPLANRASAQPPPKVLVPPQQPQRRSGGA